MAYTPQEWRNGDESTPLSAARLTHIEDGIAAKAEKGDTGDVGPEGPQGPQGEPGTDGADGFPTETQWNDLVARVEALEAE